MAKNNKSVNVVHKGGPGGIYFITFIGAAVYFVQQSEGFWGFIVAILQALVWPAFVVHNVLKILQV